MACRTDLSPHRLISAREGEQAHNDNSHDRDCNDSPSLIPEWTDNKWNWPSNELRCRLAGFTGNKTLSSITFDKPPETSAIVNRLNQQCLPAVQINSARQFSSPCTGRLMQTIDQVWFAIYVSMMMSGLEAGGL